MNPEYDQKDLISAYEDLLSYTENSEGLVIEAIDGIRGRLEQALKEVIALQRVIRTPEDIDGVRKKYLIIISVDTYLADMKPYLLDLLSKVRVNLAAAVINAKRGVDLPLLDKGYQSSEAAVKGVREEVFDHLKKCNLHFKGKFKIFE